MTLADLKLGDSGHANLHSVLRRRLLTVREYGAIGDGLTDDTLAIQAAINDAAGRQVLLPPGIYSVGALTLPDNTWLSGAGPASILRLRDNTNQAVLRNSNVVDGNANLHVSHLTIEGNSARQARDTGHGIQLLYVRQSVIEHCIFRDCGKDGVYLGMGGSFGGQIIGGDNDGVMIQDCQFYRPRRNGISVTRGVNITIQNNLFDECNIGTEVDPVYDAGSIDLEPNGATDRVKHIHILNNRITRPYRRGIQMAQHATNFGSVLIQGNHIEAAYHGICSFSTTIHDLQIANNHVQVTGPATGIVISGGGKYIQIHDNLVRSEGPGITLTNGASHGVIAGNMIISASAGIVTASAVGSCDRIHIANNACVECTEAISLGNATNVTENSNVVW